MISRDLITQVQIIAINEKVPWDLVCAIIEKESAGDTWAVRYESRWPWFVSPQEYATKLRVSHNTEKQLQMFSWGLMQVMGGVARELGFEGPLHRLCADPSEGITYGCRRLRRLMERHPLELDAISSYNQGAPYKDSTGRFNNQVYVDSVCAFRLNYMTRDWTKI